MTNGRAAHLIDRIPCILNTSIVAKARGLLFDAFMEIAFVEKSLKD